VYNNNIYDNILNNNIMRNANAPMLYAKEFSFFGRGKTNFWGGITSKLARQ